MATQPFQLAAFAVLVGIALAFPEVKATVISDDALLLRMTARDFMSAGCFHNFTILANAWSYTRFGSANYGYGSATDYYPLGTDASYQDIQIAFGGITIPALDGWNLPNPLFCPIRQDIIDGRYDGHPDFEVAQNMYGDGCSGYNDVLTSPANGGFRCQSSENIFPLSKIIQSTLEFDESGLPKPKYCNNPFFGYLGDMRCGTRLASGYFRKASTSGEEYFRQWYRDSKYSLRVGFQIRLKYNKANGLYEYDSRNNPSKQFHPLNEEAGAIPCLAIGQRLDCSNGGRIFPLSKMAYKEEYTIGSTFAFTTEAHFFFEFQGNETLTFSGDDDFWVFINEKLAVDVGGLHSPSSSKIDLSYPAVREILNLTVGEIYALDLYHAERHTDASNFQLQTSFKPRCSISQSGSSDYVMNASEILNDWKLIGGPTWGIVTNGTILLTSSTAFNTVSYAFLKQQINMGTGFVVDFEYVANGGQGEGFVFALQRDSILNKNGGSGGNLGFRNTIKSIGVVFDFCADRNTNPLCKKKEVRLHVGQINNVSLATQMLRAPVNYPNELDNGRSFKVTIRYFGSPPWLEVFIDNDLYLQKRSFDVAEALGGRNAFIGFTSSTGQTTATTLQITKLSVRTVGVMNENTKLVLDQANTSVYSDGRQVFTATLQTYDNCGQRIQFGGHSDRIKGLLVDDSDPTNLLVPTTIVDNDDGKYHLQFASSKSGKYTLRTLFGNCTFFEFSRNSTSSPTTATPTTKSPTARPSKTPTFRPSNSPTTSPTEPTPKPTTSPTYEPSSSPTFRPTNSPTTSPTRKPTTVPSSVPTTSPVPEEEYETNEPTFSPTLYPTSTSPSKSPSFSPTRAPTTVKSTQGCFAVEVAEVVVFVDPPIIETPSSGYGTLTLAQQLLLGLGLTAGSAFLVGICAILYILPARKQWLHDKEFIAKGRLAVMESSVVYEGDIQIEMMTQKLQRVLEQLSKARASRLLPLEEQARIDDLLFSQGELEETIRLIRQKKAEQTRRKSGRLVGRITKFRSQRSLRKNSRNNSSNSRGSQFEETLPGLPAPPPFN